MLLRFQWQSEKLLHDLSFLGPGLSSVSQQIIRAFKIQKIKKKANFHTVGI